MMNDFDYKQCTAFKESGNYTANDSTIFPGNIFVPDSQTMAWNRNRLAANDKEYIRRDKVEEILKEIKQQVTGNLFFHEYSIGCREVVRLIDEFGGEG